jgi:hypothetical protein
MVLCPLDRILYSHKNDSEHFFKAVWEKAHEMLMLKIAIYHQALLKAWASPTRFNHYYSVSFAALYCRCYHFFHITYKDTG